MKQTRFKDESNINFYLKKNYLQPQLNNEVKTMRRAWIKVGGNFNSYCKQQMVFSNDLIIKSRL